MLLGKLHHCDLVAILAKAVRISEDYLHPKSLIRVPAAEIRLRDTDPINWVGML